MPDRAQHEGAGVGGGQPGLAECPSGGFADFAQHDFQRRSQTFALVQRHRQGVEQPEFLDGILGVHQQGNSRSKQGAMPRIFPR